MTVKKQSQQVLSGPTVTRQCCSSLLVPTLTLNLSHFQVTWVYNCGCPHFRDLMVTCPLSHLLLSRPAFETGPWYWETRGRWQPCVRGTFQSFCLLQPETSRTLCPSTFAVEKEKGSWFFSRPSVFNGIQGT